MSQRLLKILRPIVATFVDEGAEVYLSWTYNGDGDDDDVVDDDKEVDEKVGDSLSTLVRSGAEDIVPALQSLFDGLGVRFNL